MRSHDVQRWMALFCAALVVAGSTGRRSDAGEASVAPRRVLGILGAGQQFPGDDEANRLRRRALGQPWRV